MFGGSAKKRFGLNRVRMSVIQAMGQTGERWGVGE